VISLKVIDSHCPGCSILCGVHIIEDGDTVDIEFMKHSVINHGKLCRFGVELPSYYAQCLDTCYVNGAEATYDEAVHAAGASFQTWLKERGRSDGVILCTGDATNEELLALKRMGEAFDIRRASGIGHIVSTLGPSSMQKKFGYFEVIEHAKSIVLVDVDPSVRYPLILRKIQIARNKGAEVVSIGADKAHVCHVADTVYAVTPDRVAPTLQEIKDELPSHTLFICGVGPYSDMSAVVEVNNICAATSSRAMFLKDHANSEATLPYEFDNMRKSVDEILDDIESGRLSAVILVETPYMETYLDDKRFRAACELLEHFLIVQSRPLSSPPGNAIVISIPPFYQRKGTVVNICGRLLEMGGDKEGASRACRDIITAAGLNVQLDYEGLNEDAIRMHERWYSHKPEYRRVLPPERTYPPAPFHVYEPNPYLLRAMPYPLAKRASQEVYDTARTKERYVRKDTVASGVVLAYERDKRYTDTISHYE